MENAFDLLKLGVLFDGELSFDDQINKVVTSCFITLRLLSRIKYFLTPDQLNTLVCSLIFTQVDYCNALYYRLKNETIDKLQRVQNCAARLVRKSKIPSGTMDKVLLEMHWLKVKFRSVYKILLLTHNCLNQNAPKEIINMLSYGDSTRTMKLQETRFKNKYGCRAFSHVAPKLWNHLPKEIREVKDTNKFKPQLKSFLMTRGDEYFTWVNSR